MIRKTVVSFFHSLALSGLDGSLVSLEVDVSAGLPAFHLVGLGDTAIQESRERVRSAIKNSGYIFPAKRITANLAPADIRKKGPAYDLSIALGIISFERDLDESLIQESIFLGECGLDGQIRGISGALCAALSAKKLGKKYLFVPKVNASEAAVIRDITVIGVSTLTEVVNMLEKKQSLIETPPTEIETLIEQDHSRLAHLDLSYIIGQEHAKRALMIAAAGGHNIILEGPPGSGKTLLAKSFETLLPPLEFQEMIEITQIYSVSGALKDGSPLVTHRPMRSIHHSASTIAVLGGGRDSRPGEISLAHKGVLFFDEFLEFDPKLLEALRQPLEDGEITINRINASSKYPAKFTLIAAMNPCPCGYLGDENIECKCSPQTIERYRRKLSGPILDRIDLMIRVPRVSPEDLKTTSVYRKSSEEYRREINQAREKQKKRFAGLSITHNSEMTNDALERLLEMSDEGQEYLLKAVNKLDLSTRVYNRLRKLSRTIADLEGSDTILKVHVSEALSYRIKN